MIIPQTWLAGNKFRLIFHETTPLTQNRHDRKENLRYNIGTHKEGASYG